MSRLSLRVTFLALFSISSAFPVYGIADEENQPSPEESTAASAEGSSSPRLRDLREQLAALKEEARATVVDESILSTPLLLPDATRTALARWFRVVTDRLESSGYFEKVQTMTPQALMRELQQRLYSDLSQNENAVLRDSDANLYRETGPIAQWMLDERWNPQLVALLLGVIEGGGDLKSSPRSTGDFSGLSVVIPRPRESSLNAGTGALILREEAFQYLTDRAFDLDEKGKPKNYDPSLEQILDFAKILKRQIILKAADYPTSWGRRFTEYFKARSENLESMLNGVEAMQLIALDLQGILDSLRFKATMAQNPKQALDLEKEQARVLEIRTSLLKAAEDIRLTYLANKEQPFWKFRDALYEKIAAASSLLAPTRNRVKETIEAIDRILGVAHDSQLALAFDTPFELQFMLDYNAAQLSGLGSNWETARTHTYKYREKEYTEDWTYTVKVRYKEGDEWKEREETRHHFRNWTDWEYKTFQTPSVEIKYRERIIALEEKLSAAKTPIEIDRAKADIDDFLRKFAVYVAAEPMEDHDYSGNYQARNYLLLDMVKALQVRGQLRARKAVGGIGTFVRSAEGVEEELAQVVSRIADINNRMRERRNTGLTVFGTVVGLGAAAGGCLLVLGGGGGGY